MTALVFKDDDWDVCTNAWSVASTGNDDVEICYAWTTGDGYSFMSNATGVARTTLKMPMRKFLHELAAAQAKNSAICDLRAYST